MMDNPFKDLSKPQLYAVMAGGGLIGVYALYRHHKSTGSWSPFATSSSSTAGTAGVTTTSGTVTDPTSGTVYSDTAVDPNTGMTYAAEITQYGSVATADTEYVATFGGTNSSTGVQTQAYSTGYTYQQGSANYTTTSGQNVYVSNSAWAQAVQAGLEDVSGSPSYDGTDIGTALGAYLQGQPLTAAQAALISTARGEYGPPPQGAPPVTTVPVTTPAPSMVNVPNVVGLEAFQAGPILQSVGLKVSLSGPAFKTGGPTVRIITAQDPAAGKQVTAGSTVTLTYKIQQNQLAPK